ncbi:MAG TPA: holdfast anchor protein HfaD, partial [Caulobacteraceae bacterium]|nr:holdfast anchor protein HfaD [Caulobacteraceae bacterium]
MTGDVTADQTLDVVTADTTTATTAAGANGYSAQVQSGSLDVQSVQTANGNVTANATLNISGSSGSTVMTTSATGNTGENDSLGFADLTGHVTQTTGAVSIDAESQINADHAAAANINHSVQAMGNSQEIATVGGSGTMQSDQTNQATVQANGGAVIGYTGDDQSTFSSVAMGNNLTATGTSGSTTELTLNQTNSGSITQAAQFVNAGNGQTIAASSNTVGNNISITNENNPL